MINVMRMPNTELVSGLLKMIDILPCDIVMVEVGCFSGESTFMFLNSKKISKLYAIDAWQNNLDPTDLTTILYDLSSIEKDFDERVNGFNVVKLKGNSLEMHKNIDDNSIDFVYLDSSHTYDHVKQELQLYYPKVKQGGFIGGHDYISHLYPRVTKAVNEFCTPDFTFEDYSWLYKKP